MVGTTVRRMASEVQAARPRPIIKSRDRVRLPDWTASASGAIGVTALFLCITFWWLTEDRSIPVFDAGLHLQLALKVHRELAAGHLGKALTCTLPYPPLTYLVAALGIAVGGVSVAAPIVAINLVFVPLLALGCYHVGRLIFNPQAGFLAVVFALGSPLIVAFFHVIIVDGPETAMVAVSLWGILACESFSRTRVSALAGLCVGMSMLTKEPAVFFVAGPILVALVRGGWRRWRGLLAFAGVALAVALPWYLPELSLVSSIGTGSLQTPTNTRVPADIIPHHISFDNFEWYAWNLLNAQLYLPLFLFAAVGWIWTLVGFARRRLVSPLAPELAVGAFIAWLAITETFAHDTRYSLPLLVYLAVFGSGWITRLTRRAGGTLAGILVLVAFANVAGVISGAGDDVRFKLPGANTSFRQNPGVISVFGDQGFLAGAPSQDGDILGMLRELRHKGVQKLVFDEATLFESDFSASGVQAFAQIAGLRATVKSGGPPESLTASEAILLHSKVNPGDQAPCRTLSDGSGVWIVRGPYAAGPPGVRPPAPGFYCPTTPR